MSTTIPTPITIPGAETKNITVKKKLEDVLAESCILPFRVEYAKSNRAKCKFCSNSIEKNDIRIGKILPSNQFDGFFPLWFHLNCFILKTEQPSKFPEKKPKSFEEIEGFTSLSSEDQKKICNLFHLSMPDLIQTVTTTLSTPNNNNNTKFINKTKKESASHPRVITVDDEDDFLLQKTNQQNQTPNLHSQFQQIQAKNEQENDWFTKSFTNSNTLEQHEKTVDVDFLAESKPMLEPENVDLIHENPESKRLHDKIEQQQLQIIEQISSKSFYDDTRLHAPLLYEQLPASLSTKKLPKTFQVWQQQIQKNNLWKEATKK